jgi:hypothetical protein
MFFSWAKGKKHLNLCFKGLRNPEKPLQRKIYCFVVMMNKRKTPQYAF